MKNRILIPVLAMFFAIGMSFATEHKESDPNEDYIKVNGSFMPLGTEYDCGVGEETCQIRLQNGEIHDLYDAPSAGSIKEGDGRTVEQ